MRWSPIVILIISSIFFLATLKGLYDHVYDTETNYCEMTYMFEMPVYKPIPLPRSFQQQFPQYGLYVYGEGRYASLLEKGQFTGIPVLFIPGNRGSYKQVRSLASVAYRKAVDKGLKLHFDFFTVDLDEDLGGLFGPALEKQTHFVGRIIDKILNLYGNRKKKPSGVILIGHSMGGLVARAVFTLPGFEVSQIPMVITLATPHFKPVITIDRHLDAFYNNINNFWEEKRNMTLADVVLVTIGSGKNDLQVPLHYTVTPYADIATSTTAMPSCWLTTDHEAIVWCKQLVLIIVRALFESVSPNSETILKDRGKVLDILHYHFLKKSGGKHFGGARHPRTTSFDQNGEWIEPLKRQYTYSSPKTPKVTYIMVALRKGNPLYGRGTIVATGIDNKEWIMACVADKMVAGGKMCTKGENLSQLTNILPGPTRNAPKRKVINLDMAALAEEGFTHVIVCIAPNNDMVQVHVDVYGDEGSRLWMNSAQQQALISTPANALTYTLSLGDELRNTWESLMVAVEPESGCINETPLLARLQVPWANQDIYTRGKNITLSADLQVARPVGDNRSISIQLLLDPTCTYAVRRWVSYQLKIQKFAAQYIMYLPAFCVAQLFLILAHQLRILEEAEYCPSFFSAYLSIRVFSPTLLAFLIVSVMHRLNIIPIGTENLESEGKNFALMFLLNIVALPLTGLMGVVAWGVVVMCGNGLHAIFVRIVGRSIGHGDGVAELAVSSLSKIPLVIGVGFISLAYSTCGALTIALAFNFYFLKVIKQYEDFVENLLVGAVGGSSHLRSKAADSLAAVHFHMSMTLLLMFPVLLNIPSLFTWGKYVKSNMQLEADPSLGVAVTLLIALCFLWQKKVPDSRRKYYGTLGRALEVLSLGVLVFATVIIYRISYLVTMAFLLVAVHQMFAPRRRLSSDDLTAHESSVSERAHMAVVGTEGQEGPEEGDTVTTTGSQEVLDSVASSDYSLSDDISGEESD